MKKKTGRSTIFRRYTLFLVLLAVVPMAIVSSFNFFILYNSNIGALRNDLRLQSQSTLDVLEENIDTMSKMTNERSRSTLFSSKYQKKPNSAFYAIIHQLREDSIWVPFFSNVHFYSLESDYVFGMNCAWRSDDYFNGEPGAGGYPSTSLDVQPWDRAELYDEGSQPRIMRVQETGAGSGVLIAMPLEMEHDTPISYLLFLISDSTFEDQISALEGADCVLYYMGEPIYATDPAVCESLYSGRGVPDSFRPDPALSFEKTTLRLEWKLSPSVQVRRLLPTLLLESIVTFVVLVLSLITLLAYARRAYRPVRGLLSKLPQRDDAPRDAFRYLGFLLDDYAYSQKFYEESVQELRREKYLFYILDNQAVPGQALYQQCLQEGIRVDRRYFACVLLEDSEKNYDLFERLNSGAVDDTRHGGEVSDSGIDVYSLYIFGNKYLFLLATDMEEPAFAALLASLAESGGALARVSGVVEGVQNVHTAYSAVCRAERGRRGAPPLELQLLQEAVETSNVDKAEFALRMMKGELHDSSRETQAAVLQNVRRLVGGSEGAAHVPGHDGVDGVLDSVLQQLVRNEEKAPAASSDENAGQTRSLRTVMAFIEDHYTEQNFSIKYMASALGTSASNLSHQFKKQTGQTLSRFIDELRISKAEELLAAGEKVNVVAQKLGYSTAPVFTETYKRLRGVTPSAYRSQNAKQAKGGAEKAAETPQES